MLFPNTFCKWFKPDIHYVMHSDVCLWYQVFVVLSCPHKTYSQTVKWYELSIISYHFSCTTFCFLSRRYCFFPHTNIVYARYTRYARARVCVLIFMGRSSVCSYPTTDRSTVTMHFPSPNAFRSCAKLSSIYPIYLIYLQYLISIAINELP